MKIDDIDQQNESKLPPHQGTGGVSRGTTLVGRVRDPLRPTAGRRSAP
jgi:hypothetical protein